MSVNEWRRSQSLLVYHNSKFLFKEHLILIDWRELIKQNVLGCEITNIKFAKYLSNEAIKASVIILGNCGSMSQKSILKLTGQLCSLFAKIQVECSVILSIANDKYSKPYAQVWHALTTYYKKLGNKEIKKAIVFSHVSYTLDYAFVKNARYIYNLAGNDLSSDVTLMPQNNALDLYPIASIIQNLENPVYMPRIIRPELRRALFDRQNSISEECININKILEKKDDQYIIIVNGMPRSGKTRFSQMLKDEWLKNDMSKDRKIEIIKPLMSEIKKYSKLRISMIVDGNLEKGAKAFLDELKMTTVLFEINLPKEIFMLFNKLSVLEGKKMLQETDYEIYSMFYEKISADLYFEIKPSIDLKKELLSYHF